MDGRSGSKDLKPEEEAFDALFDFDDDAEPQRTKPALNASSGPDGPGPKQHALPPPAVAPKASRSPSKPTRATSSRGRHRPSALDSDLEEHEATPPPEPEDPFVVAYMQSISASVLPHPSPQPDVDLTNRPFAEQARVTSLVDAFRKARQVVASCVHKDFNVKAVAAIVYSERLKVLATKPSFVRSQRIQLSRSDYTAVTQPVVCLGFEDEATARAAGRPLYDTLAKLFGNAEVVVGNWDTRTSLDESEAMTYSDWQQAWAREAESQRLLSVTPAPNDAASVKDESDDDLQVVLGEQPIAPISQGDPLSLLLTNLPYSITLECLVIDLLEVLPSKPTLIKVSSQDSEALITFEEEAHRSSAFQTLKMSYIDPLGGRIRKRGPGQRPKVRGAPPEATKSWWAEGVTWDAATDPIPAPTETSEPKASSSGTAGPSSPTTNLGAIKLEDTPPDADAQAVARFVRDQCKELGVAMPRYVRKSGTQFFAFFDASKVDMALSTLEQCSLEWDGSRIAFAACLSLPDESEFDPVEPCLAEDNGSPGLASLVKSRVAPNRDRRRRPAQASRRRRDNVGGTSSNPNSRSRAAPLQATKSTPKRLRRDENEDSYEDDDSEDASDESSPKRKPILTHDEVIARAKYIRPPDEVPFDPSSARPLGVPSEF